MSIDLRLRRSDIHSFRANDLGETTINPIEAANSTAVRLDLGDAQGVACRHESEIVGTRLTAFDKVEIWKLTDGKGSVSRYGLVEDAISSADESDGGLELANFWLNGSRGS